MESYVQVFCFPNRLPHVLKFDLMNPNSMQLSVFHVHIFVVVRVRDMAV